MLNFPSACKIASDAALVDYVASLPTPPTKDQLAAYQMMANAIRQGLVSSYRLNAALFIDWIALVPDEATLIKKLQTYIGASFDLMT